MTSSKNVTSYLITISQVCDELASIGEIVEESKLVRMALKRFLEQWQPFINGVVSRENLSDWNKLRDDFIQEELPCTQHTRVLHSSLRCLSQCLVLMYNVSSPLLGLTYITLH